VNANLIFKWLGDPRCAPDPASSPSPSEQAQFLRAIACLCVLVRFFCSGVDVALMLPARMQKAPLRALRK